MTKSKALNKIDESFIRSGSESVRKEDVRKVVDKAQDIQEKIINSGLFQRLAKDVSLLIDMVRSYWSGQYREVPFRIIAAVVFALLYVLSPVDLIPDFLPVIGLADDALVVAVCIAMVEEEILKYEQWQKTQIEKVA